MGYVSSILTSTIPYVLLSVVVYTVVRFFYICIRKKKLSFKRELLYAFTVAYITGVIKLTIIPDWSLYRDFETQEIRFSSDVGSFLPINLIPLKNVLSFLSGNVHVNEEDILMVVVLNLATSILLLAPMGILLPRLWTKLNNWKTILLIAIGFSCTIEIIQFFIGRVADVDDIVLNLIGALGGYGFYGTRQKEKHCN